MNKKQYSAQILYRQLIEELRAIRFYQQLPETFLSGTDELLLLIQNQHKTIFNGLHDFIGSSLAKDEKVEMDNLMQVEFPAMGKKVDWREICAEEEKRMQSYSSLLELPQLDGAARRFVTNHVLPPYESIVDTVSAGNIEDVLFAKDFADIDLSAG